MQISGTRTHVENITIEVDDYELTDIIETKLLQLINLPNHKDEWHYIDKGNVVHTEELYSSYHSHPQENILRVATPLDISVFKVINAFKEQRRNQSQQEYNLLQLARKK
jgi:hypothetical protein